MGRTTKQDGVRAAHCGPEEYYVSREVEFPKTEVVTVIWWEAVIRPNTCGGRSTVEVRKRIEGTRQIELGGTTRRESLV